MLRFTRFVVSVACTGLVIASTAFAAGDALQAKKFPKVFSSREGIHVTVVELESDMPRRALLQITGVDHPMAGRPVLHTVRGSDGRYDYVTQVNGRDFVSLTSSKDYGGELRYTLYLSGMDDIPLTYDEKLSTAAHGEEVLAQYRKLGDR